MRAGLSERPQYPNESHDGDVKPTLHPIGANQPRIPPTSSQHHRVKRHTLNCERIQSPRGEPHTVSSLKRLVRVSPRPPTPNPAGTRRPKSLSTCHRDVIEYVAKKSRVLIALHVPPSTPPVFLGPMFLSRKRGFEYTCNTCHMEYQMPMECGCA
jgi:hypothetical protein